MCINSRTLFTIFNHSFGCPKTNFDHCTDKESALPKIQSCFLNFNHFAVSYFVNKSLESLETFSLGPKAQTSTSVGFKSRIFESEAKVLAHNAYSNFVKWLQIQWMNPRNSFGNGIFRKTIIKHLPKI